MTDRRTFLRLAGTAAGAAALGGWTRASSETEAGLYQGLPDVPSALRAMRILILGGTGLTGPYQVRYALARGHQITVFNRGRHNERLPKGVEELLGDRNLHQMDALKNKDWDVVIDNPTTLPFWVKDAGEVLKEHTKHYVFISTVSVYDTSRGKDINENSPLVEYKGGDPMSVTPQDAGKYYGEMKTASEREAVKWFGNATTIIRPGLIVGPGDSSFRFTYWPYRIAQGGEVLAPGDGKDLIQVIDARDIAEWTVRMVENKTMGVFNAVGPAKPMDMKLQLDEVRKGVAANKDVRFTWVPTEFLTEQKVSSWRDMPTWIPRSDNDSAGSRADISRALKAGLTFRPLSQTSADALAWFNEQPEAARTQMLKSAGLETEREKAVLAAWHKKSGN
ncbi:MAG: NAD-dependent epimerase/dehydratase family protein [Gemmatimonas sp.]